LHIPQWLTELKLILKWPVISGRSFFFINFTHQFYAANLPPTGSFYNNNGLCPFAARMLDYTQKIYNNELAGLLQQNEYKSIVRIQSQLIVYTT